jgi:hypothetical protein
MLPHTAAAVQIRPSAVHGYGLFAEAAVAHGALLSTCPLIEVSGAVLQSQLKEYALGVPEAKWQSSAGGYIPLGNCAVLNHGCGEEANAVMYWPLTKPSGDVAVIYAARQIHSGQEVRFDYGNGYWCSRRRSVGAARHNCTPCE